MDKKGLTKLVEECAELSRIAAKKMAYLDVNILIMKLSKNTMNG